MSTLHLPKQPDGLFEIEMNYNILQYRPVHPFHEDVPGDVELLEHDAPDPALEDIQCIVYSV